jgi:hypothetical protein
MEATRAISAEKVPAHFGHDASLWQPARRVDDASRAVAAYLAQRHFAYAAAIGYRGHGGVHSPLVRVEGASEKLQKTVETLARTLH